MGRLAVLLEAYFILKGHEHGAIKGHIRHENGAITREKRHKSCKIALLNPEKHVLVVLRCTYRLTQRLFV